MIVLDGKILSTEIKSNIKKEVDNIINLGLTAPKLVAVQVGDNPASSVYVRNKVKACEECGFLSDVIKLSEDITESELLQIVNKLNNNNSVDGFIVQLPLPKHINEQHIIDAINPDKDVDGFTPINLGKMMIGDTTCFIPATPLGILNIIKHYNIETVGKNVVVVGRSNIVGKPIANLLMQKGWDANVTICHSKTKADDLERALSNADIIIAAVGIPKFIKKCKIGSTIIDVGINRINDDTTKTGTRLVGDVDFNSLSPYISAMTPVPGGVGPMTICSLMQNTLIAYKNKHSVHNAVSNDNKI